MTTAAALIEVVDVAREYRLGGEGAAVHALRGVSFAIDEGELVAIIGPSGSGKSTLLHLLGALDRPTSGVIRFAGHDLRTLADVQLAHLRNRHIGFVFQQFHLMGRMSAVRNVELPLIYRGLGSTERRARATAALEAVGLAHRLDHRPSQLSGGEQQRVAIARAIVTEPRLLLADEPTGNLDTVTGRDILTLLTSLNRERGMALVIITHDPAVAARAPRQLRMRDGRLEADERIDRHGDVRIR